MPKPSQGSSDWYEDEDSYSQTHSGSGIALAGLPPSWRYYGWWLGAIAFAALWIMDSLTGGGREPGMAGARHITHSLWGLLVTLAACYGIFHFCRHRFERLGFLLCIVVAGAALLGYGL